MTFFENITDPKKLIIIRIRLWFPYFLSAFIAYFFYTRYYGALDITFNWENIFIIFDKGINLVILGLFFTGTHYIFHILFPKILNGGLTFLALLYFQNLKKYFKKERKEILRLISASINKASHVFNYFMLYNGINLQDIKEMPSKNEIEKVMNENLKYNPNEDFREFYSTSAFYLQILCFLYLKGIISLTVLICVFIAGLIISFSLYLAYAIIVNNPNSLAKMLYKALTKLEIEDKKLLENRSAI